MSLISEIHNQSPRVRFALWALSSFVTISAVGYIWLTNIERDLFMAVHTDPQERADFLARQEDRSPNPLATIGKGFGNLAASIGGFIGFDGDKGFDRPATKDTVYLLPLSR